MLPWERKAWLIDYAAHLFEPYITIKRRSFVVMGMESRVGEEVRHALMGWLFDFPGPVSSRQLTQAEMLALEAWIQPSYAEKQWLVSEEFRGELVYILKEMQRDAIQRTAIEQRRPAPDL